MRYLWEEKDVWAGRTAQKPDTGLTGAYLVGYRIAEEGNVYGLVSLADGLFSDAGTSKLEVANELNRSGLIPTVLSDR